MYFCLNRCKKIYSGFGQQTRHADVEPLIEIGMVNRNNEYKSVEENTENFSVRIVEHPCENFREPLQIAATSYKV